MMQLHIGSGGAGGLPPSKTTMATFITTLQITQQGIKTVREGVARQKRGTEGRR
jgi:hypothetical protein